MTEEQFKKIYEALQINVAFTILTFIAICIIILIYAFQYIDKEQDRKDKQLKEKIRNEIEKAKKNE